MEDKDKNGNGLNGSHTDLLSLTTIYSHRTISSQKKIKNKNKFSSFTFSYPSHFICVHRLLRVETELETQKRNKDLGLEGFKG